VTAWLRRHPLAVFLPLQALLYCWNLALLSPWGDEAGTLLMVRESLGTLVRWAAEDVHPPLYYVSLYCWQRIPLGIDWAVQARLLSVLFALLATVALDGLWGRRLEERTRRTLLAFWTLSPCLLLYSRMCRSYSLQCLLAIVAMAMLMRAADAATWRNGTLLALALLAGMYSHYVAGIALVVVANLTLLARRRWAQTLAMDCALAIGYLPWAWRLLASLNSWGAGAGRGYALTGSRLLEIPVKFAYWCMSFVLGEAVPDAVLVGGALLLPLVGALAWQGARKVPDLAWPAAGLAVVGFTGVARWVSYPFVPARMLFVLPFFLILTAAGAATRPRWGKPVVAVMLLFSLSGIACYFTKTGFRNKQYPVPIRQIAARILRESQAGTSAILVDSTNSDPVAMLYAVHPQRTLLQTGRAETPAALSRVLADPQVRSVWFLRNTHDVSPGGLNQRFEAQIRAAGMAGTVQPYEPFTPLEHRLMGAGAPRYFHELVEFRR